MVEGFSASTTTCGSYGLQRSEGVLLRYLSQLYKTLQQNVPERAKTERSEDALGFFRTLLEHTDTSLLEEWESLLDPALRRGPGHHDEVHQIVEAKWLRELITEPRVLATRLRTEMHLLVKALAAKNWEDAVAAVAQPAEVEGSPASLPRLQKALGRIAFRGRDGAVLRRVSEPDLDRRGPPARPHPIVQTGERTWTVEQTLVDPEGDNLWAIHGEVDLRDATVVEAPLIRLRRISI